MRSSSARGGDESSAREWLSRSAEFFESDLDEAERCLRRALELDGSLGNAWFNLGLIHKWRREWQDCLRCNREAVRLDHPDPGSGEPAYWNAGIAATALRDWEAARWAWTGFGVPIGEGAGEIQEDFGLGAVRLPHGETVWGRRICPSRMRLESVPLPDSGFRCGDVVLHDGSPEGVRVLEGQEFSVFDVIEPFTRSDLPTIELLIDASASDVQILVDAISAHDGFTVENWTESVTFRCEACSHGRVDYDDLDHDHPQPEHIGYVRLGCSGEPAIVSEIAVQWQAESDGVLQQTVVHED